VGSGWGGSFLIFGIFALIIIFMYAIIAIVIGAVRENKMMLNPVGIYIRYIAWSQDLTAVLQ
jgi:type IV secretory pathway TrbF-like protein